jgi:hypothetical protein
MRFWDASAIVPLLLSETSSGALQALVKQDPIRVILFVRPPFAFFGCIPCEPPMRYSSPPRMLRPRHQPASLDIVTLDERLAVAACKEGFPVLDAQHLSRS